MTVLDLFSGIGGMSLGLESAGFQTVAFCEVEPFCRAVLEHHWPGVPIHADVRTLRGADVGAVDLVAGGFPCQPVSVAGRRKGEADARWLWPEMLRIVREVRPRWVLAENVPGLRTLGADRVLEDLEGEGYACWPLVVGACDVGAPHRRKRVWIVANRESSRREVGPGPKGREENEWTVATIPDRSCSALAHGYSAGRGTERSGGLLDGERQTPRDDADGCGIGPVGEPTGRGLAGPGGSDSGSLPAAPALRWPARPGEPQHEWEEPRLVYSASSRCRIPENETAAPSDAGENRSRRKESERAVRRLLRLFSARPCPDGDGRWHIGWRGDEWCVTNMERAVDVAREWYEDEGLFELGVGGPAHGLPERLVRRANREALRALGNAVVPQVVEAIGRAILAAEASGVAA